MRFRDHGRELVKILVFLDPYPLHRSLRGRIVNNPSSASSSLCEVGVDEMELRGAGGVNDIETPSWSRNRCLLLRDWLVDTPRLAVTARAAGREGSALGASGRHR